MIPRALPAASGDPLTRLVSRGGAPAVGIRSGVPLDVLLIDVLGERGSLSPGQRERVAALLRVTLATFGELHRSWC